MEKPGISEAKRKRKSFRWRARNVKGKWYDLIFLKVYFLMDARQ